MKRRKNYVKRGIVYLAILCIAIGITLNLPMNVMEAYAAAQAPSSASYLTKAQLEVGYDLAVPNQQAGKLAFGKSDSGQVQEWYILGSDNGVNGGNDNIVLFACTSMTANGVVFNSDGNDRTFAYAANTGYGDTEGTITVYANHYGASELRKKLNGEIYNNSFTTAEKSLMNETTFETIDEYDRSMGSGQYYTYSLTDKIYALFAQGNLNEYCYAGSNNNKTIHSSNWGGSYFGLRTGYNSDSSNVLWAIGNSTYYAIAQEPSWVRPAININLTNVIFASSAKADGSSGTLGLNNAMTLRLNGSSTVASKVYNSADQIMVYPKQGEIIGLVIQGNDGTNDWYYSKSINQTEPIRVLATDIVASGVVTDVPDLMQCEVWIEKTVDGLAYSVDSAALTEITSVEVTEVDAPVTGSNLDVTAVCAITGVNGAQVKWNPNHTQAAAQTDYSANVTVTPTEGYGFAITCAATFNGENITPSYNADGSMVLTKAFPTTGGATVTPPPVTPPSVTIPPVNTNADEQNEWDEVPKTGDKRVVDCLLVIGFVAGVGSFIMKKKQR